ncbi:hypothetical protein SETIT_8G053700v2 [Setaria italica]|uniref:Uncharacterized protein n=1 Tax=Setaria italica TaxID=4555 RepID=A0A368S4R3_SETIT|nr:hypothetical protein SETIT_8G053700v2 [Setaria italica]
MVDNKEPHLKGSSSSSSSAENLLQSTTGKSDGSSNDGTAS